MIAEGFDVCCPYCGCSFETGKPRRPSDVVGRKKPEVECLPYTRDIGRFDPKSARERNSPDGWTQVCKDFMTFLGFQRIGILRQDPDQPVDVMYRVQYCPGCKRLFDVYANYTPKRSLAQIWPHLFAEDSTSPQEIKRYSGASWPLWLVEKATRALRLPNTAYGAAVTGLLFLVICLLPWLVRVNWGEPEGTQKFWMTLLSYSAAAAGIVALLVLLGRGVRKLQNGDEFYALFRTRTQRDVSYWYNYTLCRFIGVQVEGRLPQISQVEIWGSGLALLSLVLVWAIAHAAQVDFLAVLAAVSGFAGLYWLLRKLLARQPHRRLISAALAVVIVFLAFSVFGPRRGDGLVLSGEVVFWSGFAYLTGMAAWIAMSATLYVLKGVTRIPMRISPLTQFREMKPLLEVQRFSTNVMAVLFITLVSLVFLLELFREPLSHLSWLTYWVQIALAVLFAAIGVGLRPVFILVTAAYLALTIYLYSMPGPLVAWNIQLDPVHANLIVFGGFLTFIMYFHLREGRTFINKIVETEKEEVLDDIDRQINQLRAITSHSIQEAAITKDKTQFFEYTQGLHGLDALLNLRKTIQSAQFRSESFAARVIGPLLWSIVLPSVWDLLTQFFLEQWIQ